MKLLVCHYFYFNEYLTKNNLNQTDFVSTILKIIQIKKIAKEDEFTSFAQFGNELQKPVWIIRSWK